jgi:hypothetical protein
MEIKPDFSEVANLTAGEYRARVTDCELRESKAKPGTHYLNWTCEVFGCTDEKLNGQKFWHTTPHTGRGAGIFKDFYKALMHRDLDEGAGLNTDDLMGREFRVVVVMELYEGKERPKVKSVAALVD